jgi:hypothetical protein
MRRIIFIALLLLGTSLVLGATVFRAEVASAAATLNVVVTNNSDNPVPIRDADNPASDSVMLSHTRAFPNHANSFADDLYTVPANKRLVIEYMHTIVSLPTGDQAACRILFPGKHLEIPLVHLTTLDFADPPERWGASLPARLYVDAGDLVQVGCTDKFAFIGQLRSLDLLVSGYLVTVA